MPVPQDVDRDQARAAARLVWWVFPALLVTAGVLAGVIVLVNRPDWLRGLLAAGVVSVLAAALSIGPLVWGLRGAVQRVLAGYLSAAGVRAVASLGGALLAVRVGGYPAAPTLLLMVVFYFALLAVETAVVAKALWNTRT